MNMMELFKDLPPVSAGALAEFDKAAEAAQKEVGKLCIAEDNPEQSMGPEAGLMIENGMRFVTDMLRSSMSFTAGEILGDEMQWGRSRLPVFGVSLEMVLRNLERYRDALKRSMTPEAYAQVRPYLEAMMSTQKNFVEANSKGSESP